MKFLDKVGTISCKIQYGDLRTGIYFQVKRVPLGGIVYSARPSGPYWIFRPRAEKNKISFCMQTDWRQTEKKITFLSVVCLSVSFFLSLLLSFFLPYFPSFSPSIKFSLSYQHFSLVVNLTSSGRFSLLSFVKMFASPNIYLYKPCKIVISSVSLGQVRKIQTSEEFFPSLRPAALGRKKNLLGPNFPFPPAATCRNVTILQGGIYLCTNEQALIFRESPYWIIRAAKNKIKN